MTGSTKRNILVVDDQELNRSILSIILEEDYNIIEASNGQDAWNIMQEMGDKISLILLDIVMPVMDGIEFLSYIHNASVLKEIPIIFVTTETYIENIHAGIQMGVRDIIAKPFDPYLVKNRVNNLINLTADSGGAAETLIQRTEPYTVLIIDDVEVNREILREALKGTYRIIEAEDGSSALAQIEAHQNEIAAVLLDIIMPVMDGYELIQQVKERKLLTGIPIIAVTSERSASQIQKIRSYGICEIIHKPFNPLIIKNRVDNMIKLFIKQS